MKKKLLSFIFPFLAFSLSAQNPCPTCHQGTKGTMVDSAQANMPRSRVGNGNGSLGQSYVNQNICGLNYTQASILTETRSSIYAFNANGSGFPCTLNISGLPCGGNSNILKAYVYYEASYTEATPPATSVVITNPVPATYTVAATMIGQAGPKCWGETGCAAYRADVTADISGTGNYNINLTGFNNAAWEVDGVTLIIIYKDPNATYSGSISLWDGNIVQYYLQGAMTYTGINVCATTGTASAFGVYGDIQINVNGGINTDTYNASTATFSNTFWNFNKINTSATSGQTSCVFNSYTNNGGDCYAWILAGYYWQNTTCQVCTPSSTMTLTTTQVNPTCGSNNGTATVNVTGGTAPYTYAWNPSGQTNATATGLSAGTYTVTVTSSGGCSTTTAVVTLISSALSVSANVTSNDKCFGDCNGSAVAVITGGTAPFTYAWTPSGGSNVSASGLCAGTYTVTVQDINGCTGTAAVTITQPPLLTATATVVNDKCNGGTNGSSTVSVAGGTMPYTYLWNPGGQTTATATGLIAGSYTVTVTDNNGCQTQVTITITQPPPMTVTILSINNVSCNGGNNGSISISASGGNTPYTYLWSPIGGTNAIGNGLTAGNYTVTVTDNNGCSQTATATVTQPTPVTANASVLTNVSCFGGNNGGATVAVGGGNGPYTYLWSPTGGVGPSAGGLTAGTYTITVTDNNGCVGTSTVTITQPPAINTTMSFTQASCNNANGTATVTVNGGVSPYTYLWTPGNNTNSTATGLFAGSYTVLVTDNNGCTTTAAITVTQPSAVTATISSSTQVSCFGGSDGTATASASGGNAPYTYLWSPSGGTNITGTGLSAGTYSVVVTDNNGCQSTAIVTIGEPSQLTSSITASTDVLCNGNNTGNATVTAVGGTPNYGYSWSPSGGTNAMGTGMTAGTYTVTVTDANGCTATTTVIISEPPALTANVVANTNVSCNGGNDGSATVTAGGGTPPYAYNWSPNTCTNANATALSAGSYTVTVTDRNGCQVQGIIVITQPAPLTETTSFTQATCNNANGTATVNVNGGTGPYTYFWNPTSQTTATATGLLAGIYTVNITDNNGCTSVINVTVTQPSAVTASIGGSTNVSCFGGNNGSANGVGIGGSLPYTYLWSPTGGTNASATGLTAGIYTISITDNNGCISTAAINITQPALLTATITSVTNVSCNGGNNGSATVTVGGGTLNYSYIWTPIGGNTATGSGLTAGLYTVTVTDGNGCTASAGVTIAQPLLLTATISATKNVSCFGDNNGSSTVTAAGGVAPYTYLWSPNGGNTATGSGLTAGSYTITVTDNNGCVATNTVTLTQPPVLATSLAITNVSCFNGNNGTIATTTTGGTTPYKYLWNNGQTTANASLLTNGTYTVVVTDANGCTTSAVATLTEPTQLFVTASGPQSVCYGAPANLIANATGGTSPYNYSWSPAGGTNANTTTNPLTSTVYTVTVTDANGCTAKTTVAVSVNPPLSLSLLGNTAVCPNGTISLTATASGGDGIYSYQWMPSNQTNQNVTFTPTKDSTVIIQVTDACFSSPVTLTIPITVDPLPKVSFSADLETGCIPLCVQFRNLTTISSGSVFAWGWSFGNGDSSKASNPIYCYKDTGLYSVSLTATSDSGCSSTLNIVRMINAYPPPAANFTYSPNPVNIMAPQVQFTDVSTGEFPVAQWYWTFGQGDSASMMQNPTHNYTDTGTFCARLIIVDIHGCIDSITNCLVVDPLFTFYIPDAFTPNGDGINDLFMPKGSYIRDFEMYIYDRWGMQLFHTTDITNGWNGAVKNSEQMCQEDTYVYLMKVTDTQGNLHSYTGKLNLIR